jgi:hypothetical protein
MKRRTESDVVDREPLQQERPLAARDEAVERDPATEIADRVNELTRRLDLPQQMLLAQLQNEITCKGAGLL